jgi:cytochrome c553
MKRANFFIPLLTLAAGALCIVIANAADAPAAAAPATSSAAAPATAPATTAPAPAAPASAAPATPAAAPTASPAKEPAAPAKPDLDKGKQIAATVCAACHAADGNSVMPANPKLAGQHPDYLIKQLMNFQPADGKPPERNNAVMMGMASTLTSADDMRNVAAYFASQTPKPGAAQNKDTLALGQKLYRGGNIAAGVPACGACHGPTGAGIPSQFPRISGQYADYTETQLKAFRSGERANDPSQMMRVVASRLSDQDIKALADYIAGLH